MDITLVKSGWNFVADLVRREIDTIGENAKTQSVVRVWGQLMWLVLALSTIIAGTVIGISAVLFSLVMIVIAILVGKMIITLTVLSLLGIMFWAAIQIKKEARG